jgi:hypothetical protein
MILSVAAALLAALKAAPVYTSGSALVTSVMPVLKRCRFLPRVEVWIFALKGRDIPTVPFESRYL